MTFSLKKLKVKLLGSDKNKLLEQVFMTFDATLLKIKTNHKETRELNPIIEAIVTLLKGEKNWRNANRIEQLIIPLLDEEELSFELGKKLFLVKDNFDKKTYEDYVSMAKTGNRGEKEALLTHITKEQQWHNEVQLVRLDYAKSARIKCSLLFILSFILFVMPRFTEILLNVPEGSRRYFILTALLSGWMGGTFSMLLGLKKHIQTNQLNHLKLSYRWDFIIVRAIIGMCAGLLFFYFFESGMLGGALLPNFSNGGLDKVDFAL